MRTCAKPNSQCSADVLRTPMYLFNGIGCIIYTVKVVPIVPLVPHQFHQLYRTNFTSAKSGPNRVHQKKQRIFCKKRHQFYRKQCTFYKKQGKHFGTIQSAHRFGAIQCFRTFGTFGAIQLIHLVQYKWYTQYIIGNTAGTIQALITHLVQCIVNS